MKKNIKTALAMVLSIAVMVTFIPLSTVSVAAAVNVAAPTNVVANAASKTSIKVTWEKVSNAKGYVVYRNDGKGFKKVKDLNKASFTNKKLKKNKTYSYKIKAYSKSEGSKKYSKASYTVKVSTNASKNVKSVDIQKKNVELYVGDTEVLVATVSPSEGIISDAVTFTSSNSDIAKVDSNTGEVKAVRDGTAYVYARAHNGVSDKTKVIVYASSLAKDCAAMSNNSTAATVYADHVGYELAYDMDLADDKTGFRTAGSDAEHAAADYLVEEFEAIGLKDVKKEAVTVDKWQFNDAKLIITYKNGDKDKTLTIKNDKMVSYASPGTVQSSKDIDWKHMTIVEMGMGREADYEKYYDDQGLAGDARTMAGKIVLVGVDQWNESWIDTPYDEAYYQGAEAIITYQLDGYGKYNDDTINIQDLCSSNLGIPCVSIAPNTAIAIQKALKADANANANFYVDNEVNDEAGTGYNVIGKIEGSGDTGQQILYAAHYDKYFYGFEDDCIAVGLVAGIAKDMIDSGYKPVNDIYFIAHAAEEWGEFDTSTDWAIGSWENITKKHPEWQGTTLALFNYELPAIDNFKDHGILRSSYEMGNISEKYLASDAAKYYDNFYSGGWQILNDDEMTQTDVIAFAQNGVPSVMPRQDDRTTWTKNRYHTPFDNNDENKTKEDGVYSKGILQTDINTFASMGAYVDYMPALELDFTDRCAELEEAIKGTEEYAASASVTAYKTALEELETTSKAFLAKGEAINKEYTEALAKGDTLAADKARKAGIKYNETALKAFRAFQDDCIGLADYGDTEVYHKAVQNNLDIYSSVISALSTGTVSEDDIWIANELNGYVEYNAYIYSDETCKLSYDCLMNTKLKEKNEANWGDKITMAIPDSWKTTKNAYEQWCAEEDASASHDSENYASYVTEYQGYVGTLKTELQKYVASETAGMEAINTLLK